METHTVWTVVRAAEGLQELMDTRHNDAGWSLKQYDLRDAVCVAVRDLKEARRDALFDAIRALVGGSKPTLHDKLQEQIDLNRTLLAQTAELKKQLEERTQQQHEKE